MQITLTNDRILSQRFSNGSWQSSMRLCRIAPQFSLRAVDGPDVFINMASQALRRAAIGPSGGSMSNLGEDSKNDAPESHSDKWEPSSPSEHRSATDAHRSNVGRSASEFDNSRPGVKSLRHPRRIEFYHRRYGTGTCRTDRMVLVTAHW